MIITRGILAGMLALLVALLPGCDRSGPSDAPDNGDGLATASAKAQEALAAIEEEYDAARTAYVEKISALMDKLEPGEEFELPPDLEQPATVFAQKYLDLADKVSDAGVKLEAYLQSFNLAQSKETMEEALDRMITRVLPEKPDDPAWGELAAELEYGALTVGPQKAREALEAIQENASRASAKATAMLSSCVVALDARDTLPPDELANWPTTDELKASFKELVDRYGNIEHPGSLETIKKEAEGFLYELEHLQVGMPAPDLVGKNLAGETVKLSDFRGQVVALDFWGFW